MEKQKIIIIGAAGRDFHNFNVFYRDNPNYQVVAFTASQIPDIDDRKYPKELAGDLYPDGIPIYTQEKLPDLIKEFDVDECVFAYSDVNYHDVMALSAKVNSAGADFKLMGPKHTSLKSKKPVISVCAVRTGSGKSQSSRKVIEHLLDLGLKVVAIRHPMPYGDLVAQKVQRYADLADLDKYDCTIEEMEEYEPHIDRGNIIYSGVDYQAILDAAENDPDGCDLILWDGGNNDFSFIDADLAITIADPHRPGHEISYYPGQVSLEMADLAVINKVDSAKSEDIQTVEDNIKTVNPQAQIIKAESTISVDDPDLIKDKKVLIVEDGPTLTHGEMKFGAGTVAAQRFEASQIIDPRPYLAGSLKDTFEKYPDIGQLLPAMGYGHQQLKDLEETINQTDCDTVIIGTPIDLSRVININKPHTRVHYELNEVGGQTINQVLDQFVAQEVKQ
ncbi:Uncharacterised protein [Alloiococcus otitis]|uniref:CobW/HypB/UreG nucleotide-binding domain-containing protein n=1 Tax=Alloiococcus otitis ATCC 51267 TaxID=883081 RepID=K9E7K1_9LACT|nr:cyclic 2,3-diphosphoglycerate synthase [Alloiococcus otitis]EKU93179.1 hypothetical protein HMPREF9698_01340 [Alloiococcus otitis ATCC 51267]SUU80517.1 Uncharacterised protein [Alloiococcus otitis]